MRNSKEWVWKTRVVQTVTDSPLRSPYTSINYNETTTQYLVIPWQTSTRKIMDVRLWGWLEGDLRGNEWKLACNAGRVGGCKLVDYMAERWTWEWTDCSCDWRDVRDVTSKLHDVRNGGHENGLTARVTDETWGTLRRNYMTSETHFSNTKQE